MKLNGANVKTFGKGGRPKNTQLKRGGGGKKGAKGGTQLGGQGEGLGGGHNGGGLGGKVENYKKHKWWLRQIIKSTAGTEKKGRRYWTKEQAREGRGGLPGNMGPKYSLQKAAWGNFS